MACGTGACAALVASVLNDLTGRKATVKLLEWRFISRVGGICKSCVYDRTCRKGV